MIAANSHCAAEDELKKKKNNLLNEMDLSEIVSNAFTELTKSCISVSLTNVCSKINYIYWKGKIHSLAEKLQNVWSQRADRLNGRGWEFPWLPSGNKSWLSVCMHACAPTCAFI